MTRKINHLIPTGSRRHSRRFPPTLFLRLLPALLYFLVNIIAHLRAHRLVYEKLVERRDSIRTFRTHKVTLEQKRLDAVLAVQRAAARRLDRLPEELLVDGTDEG